MVGDGGQANVYEGIASSLLSRHRIRRLCRDIRKGQPPPKAVLDEGIEVSNATRRQARPAAPSSVSTHPIDVEVMFTSYESTPT